ncbi:DUF695 domain-containing protein [Mucilaginibacter lappiensis]|uniref:DUF695 domain-containing protein n=1 Tax=Mucilaginibacter lappiensis TaxID=354630 RepID=A0A1N7G5V9_9SPHI|nr:DUF695 domain-containing protein [Mucilaginibacter lappiensis]MBB6112863.1 hypothetical protein [Mucilaginibacter lappiensis]MBB6131434.1 hypothetical protein [Mucilaginibacter lappiensis]SIS07951.1 Family of unknown function [Mucilaginibacter lappiensis]
MKSIPYISLAVLFVLLISNNSKAQKKDSTYPPENFSAVQAKLDNGKPVVGSINMAYKNYNKKGQYPWCLTINMALELKNVSPNGLPVKVESDIANKFEDQLLDEIKKLATAHYIGHLYNDSFLDIYIYLNDPKKVATYLQSQVNKKGITRGFAYKIEQDPNWSTVQHLLK